MVMMMRARRARTLTIRPRARPRRAWLSLRALAVVRQEGDGRLADGIVGVLRFEGRREIAGVVGVIVTSRHGDITSHGPSRIRCGHRDAMIINLIQEGQKR